MSISLILSMTTLSLLLATAGCGIAIAVLERKSAVPPAVERVFMGLAAAGSTALVSCVVLLHPVTGGTPVAHFALPSVTSIAVASEVGADELPACVPLDAAAAYDRGQARSQGRGAQGEVGHEVSVFRSPGPR